MELLRGHTFLISAVACSIGGMMPARTLPSSEHSPAAGGRAYLAIAGWHRIPRDQYDISGYLSLRIAGIRGSISARQVDPQSLASSPPQ